MNKYLPLRYWDSRKSGRISRFSESAGYRLQLEALEQRHLLAGDTLVISEFMARNATSLEQLESEEGIENREFPAEVLAGLKAITFEALDELAEDDPIFARVWDSYRAFMERSRAWQEISEHSYLSTRTF